MNIGRDAFGSYRMKNNDVRPSENEKFVFVMFRVYFGLDLDGEFV